jgi:hypothetical protein
MFNSEKPILYPKHVMIYEICVNVREYVVRIANVRCVHCVGSLIGFIKLIVS